ncbi:MAG: histidine phosphatase family protein [Geminicoccaceae bacterium]
MEKGVQQHMVIENWQERLGDRAKNVAFQPKCDRFYFLRHGQTEHNKRRVCQGNTDIPLNETGLAQADAAAGVLAKAQPVAVRASDLMRVRQTAAPVAKQLGLKIETDARLRERSFGIYENQSINGQLWSFDHPSIETLEDFVDRSWQGFDWALQQDDVLVVTHGGLRRVLTGLLRIEMADWTAHNALPMRFTRMADDSWKAEALTEAGAWPANGPEPIDLDR